jgi:leucyl aminopeptidase
MIPAAKALTVEFSREIPTLGLTVRLAEPHDASAAAEPPQAWRRTQPCLVDSDGQAELIWPTPLPTTPSEAAALGGRIMAHLMKLGCATVVLDVAERFPIELVAHLAYGATLRAYEPPTHKTEGPLGRRPMTLKVRVASVDAAQATYADLEARAAGVHLARDLVSTPPNLLNPEIFAQRIQALSAEGLEIRLLDEAELTRLGLNALLAVGRGSAKPSLVAVMEWRGGGDEPPLAFVGKGVTFDAGGLNIKPAMFMWKMKTDMGGAAAVVGALLALARRKAKVNVVGLVGLVENMPDGDAYRPGDVLTTHKGKTVEVIDTDNEGRLVLCDLLSYAEATFNPRAIIDLATLTGGARMALGAVYAPLFSNDDLLAEDLAGLGEAQAERLWRLPCGPEYDGMFRSQIADMTNGRTDIAAHAIVAARFLARFVDATPWAHIDMAATCVFDEGTDLAPPGPTGFGVALLDAFATRELETHRSGSVIDHTAVD